MECTKCGKRIRGKRQSYEYAVDAGLDPKEYSVILENVEVMDCGCGQSAVIPALDSLHAAIAVAIAVDPHPVRPSGLKFVRRFLGMTQKHFADLVRSTSESVCYWETGHRTMSPEMDVNVRTRCLVELHRDSRVAATKLMERGDVVELMERLFQRVEASADWPVVQFHARPHPKLSTANSIMDGNGLPMAWAIPELERIQNGHRGSVN